jgi:hypothetical protein
MNVHGHENQHHMELGVRSKNSLFQLKTASTLSRLSVLRIDVPMSVAARSNIHYVANSEIKKPSLFQLKTGSSTALCGTCPFVEC